MCIAENKTMLINKDITTFKLLFVKESRYPLNTSSSIIRLKIRIVIKEKVLYILEALDCLCCVFVAIFFAKCLYQFVYLDRSLEIRTLIIHIPIPENNPIIKTCTEKNNGIGEFQTSKRTRVDRHKIARHVNWNLLIFPNFVLIFSLMA